MYPEPLSVITSSVNSEQEKYMLGLPVDSCSMILIKNTVDH